MSSTTPGPGSPPALQVPTTYFLQTGPENTAEVLRLVKARAEALGIKTILVATTQGDTGAQAAALFRGHKVVVVTHCTGHKAPNTQELTAENRARILEHGGLLLTAQHAFGGVGRAVRRHLNTYQTEEIIAHVLRLFGQGMKVACEIAVMAADAGLARTDEDAIAIGGTGRGADTAVVLRPANAQDFFQLRLKEIICKPRL